MTEREMDRRLKIRTLGREEEPSVHYASYEPTPYPVLRRLADSGYVRRKDHLLDYGCGKGRVLFFMASAIGCRATGIDRSPKLIEKARENRRTSGLGDRVALECCPAEKYPISNENVFFFFNPFSETIFAAVLRRIADRSAESGRPLTVLCYYPSEEYIRCLDNTPEVRRIEEIDCSDLFRGHDPRERIVAYRSEKG